VAKAAALTRLTHQTLKAIDPNSITAAGLLARKYLILFSHGARHFAWYTWGVATPFCLATTAPDGFSLNAAGRAFGQLQRWLVGAKLQSVDQRADGTWLITLCTPTGQPALIVWSPDGPRPFTIPGSQRARAVETLAGTSFRPRILTPLQVGAVPLMVVGR
jgi:hypothetical protein